MRYFRIACLSVLLATLTLLTVRMVQAETRRFDTATMPWMPSIAIGGPYSQEAVLTPMGPGSDNHFGSTIAVTSQPDSAGAYWAVVGAPGETGGGAAYIFSLAAGATEWHQEVRLANSGSTGDYFGGAVAIGTGEVGSGTIAIGVPFAASGGKVLIFTRKSGGAWASTAEIPAPAGARSFGASLLLSGNAFLFVGAPNDGGEVITYALGDTTWSLQRTILPPDPDTDTHFGQSLYFDGLNLLVGRISTLGAGSAYLFFYHSTIGTWTFEQKLAPMKTSSNDCGASVATCGATAFLGCPGASGNSGAVAIFSFDSASGTWTEQPALFANNASEHNFGESLAVNNGTTNLFVALDGGTTSARMFGFSGGTWAPNGEFKTSAKTASFERVALSNHFVFVGSPNAELDLPERGVVETYTPTGSKLASLRATTDAIGYDFAFSVALSGSTALVSSPEQQNVLGDTGTANVFVRTAEGNWDWQAGLPQAMDEGRTTTLGCTPQVAIDGDTAVVGEPSKPVGTHPNQGVASIYVRSGTTWTLQETLYDRVGQSGDLFGCSVAIAGDTVVVGDPGMGMSTGGGFVSTRVAGVWSLPTKIVAGDGASGDFLGSSSAVGGNTVALGSSLNNSGAGAAYVFAGSGTAWTQSQKLTLGVVTGQPTFATSLSMSRDGRTLLVGAPRSKTGATISGSALVYTNSGRSWTLQQTLTSPLPTDGGLFGASVSIDANTAIVGEPANFRSHIFVRNGSSWAEKSTIAGTDDTNFGASVSISKGTALVGAIYEQNSGRAFVLDDADEIFADGFN